MSPHTLFIADLHLSEEHEEIYTRFKYFIKNKARHARALYILGDLFEYYLGDDAISGVVRKVSKDLNDLVKNHHTKCYFMAGNRDFLVANEFAKIKLIHDSCVIKLGDKKVILTHGDCLCTDDIEYQKIRQLLRSPQWQQKFLAKSLAERIEFAQQARLQSQQHTQNAKLDIMDVNQQAVLQLFQQHNTHYMLHGHTHRPAFHHFIVDETPYHRMVLGDWHYQSSYIEFTNNNFQLVTY